MLPRRYRLSAKNIPEIAFRGHKRQGEGMIVRVIYPHESKLSEPQFAFSISKKVDNRASARNYVRRKLRAALLSLLSEAKISPARYLIIIKSVALGEMEVSQLKQELARVLHASPKENT